MDFKFMADPTKLIKKIIPQNSHWKIDLLNNWQEITTLAGSNLKIESILDKTLVVGVPHPAIAHQLSMVCQALLEKLKSIVPDCKIERLAFKIVDFCSKEKAPFCQKTDKKPEPENKEHQLSIQNPFGLFGFEISLNQKEMKSLDSVCCQRLKKLLHKFYVRCKKKEAFNAKNVSKQERTQFLAKNVLLNLCGYS